ncbi:hypothetical protein DCCM_4210 [Desulfocucumis palustris]|uniref:Uncharacterized protein n=1 Tax=Desulfocucumis palustris TaxID=1898651 RepID=A0A2L2XFH4_9FIRM|nr:hypothetical protein DCCM_4210 [Desulfocucumis palustris]
MSSPIRRRPGNMPWKPWLLMRQVYYPGLIKARKTCFSQIFCACR